MKFVFLCDANYLKGDMVNFQNNFPTNHELVTMTSEDLLQSKSIIEGRSLKCSRSASSAVAAATNPSRAAARTETRKSLLEVLPLGIVSRGRRNEPIKGRSQNRNQEIFFNPAASAEELYLQVDKFVAAPPSGYSYPRGAAK